MAQPQYVPVLFQVPSPYSDNPWVLQHLNRELALQDDASPLTVGAEVLAQYEGHEEPAGPCPCGGQYWYRATTGGHKCPQCGTFTTSAGVPLGVTKAKEADYV